MPLLFPTPPPRNRPVTHSVKRRITTSPPKISQPSAAPFTPMPNITAGPTLPRYNPWQNVYSGLGILAAGFPGVPLVVPVSGFSARPLLVVLAPLPTLGGVLPGPLSALRQDFAQAVNAAMLVGKFKGDGVTKPDHHLKNFEAVM
ncbi:hypothetical protein R1flu_019025 [Riccia fluitans]|uniref:Uncharacterized protein n=1 Tax=Riccia fluitans TaxID=41844 RepID=A0ABD1ZHH7_9MARC